MTKKDLLGKLEVYHELKAKVSSLLKYQSYFDIVDRLDKHWLIDGDILYISDDESRDGVFDCAGLVISSLGALGKEFILAESDGVMYVMAHDEDNWEDSYVYILTKNKEVIHE